MDDKENDRRKRRCIIDDDVNDDDNNDYDEDEDNDDEASNDVDDDEVVDKSSNPPGINDSLACTNKGGEKRSGSNVVNDVRGCNSPPPPHPGQGPIILLWGEEEERIERSHCPAGGRASTSKKN